MEAGLMERNRGDCYELRQFIRAILIAGIVAAALLVAAIGIGIFMVGRASARDNMFLGCVYGVDTGDANRWRATNDGP
jgi:hypothetical protein